MKILLIGEYSNVHHSLATGLRALGHSVTVVSDGDGWKNYPRDIDISRTSTHPWHTLSYLLRLHRLWPKLKGYDVVQLINPVFLELKAEPDRAAAMAAAGPQRAQAFSRRAYYESFIRALTP